VKGGIGPGKNRGMGREGQRNRRKGIFKEKAFLCQFVNMRGFYLFISITSEMIGADRIYGNQEKIEGGALLCHGQGAH
jgi:hypothetical protein